MKRMDPHILYAVVLVLAANVSVHAGKRLFSLTIAAPSEPLKSGSELRLHVTLRNTSEARIGFIRSPGLIPEEGFRYEIEVRDANGHAAPPSEHVRELSGKRTVEWSSNLARWLNPGESFVDEVCITEFYDLSRPGKYTVSVAREFPPAQGLGKGSVKSNVVTVVVTP